MTHGETQIAFQRDRPTFGLRSARQLSAILHAFLPTLALCLLGLSDAGCGPSPPPDACCGEGEAWDATSTWPAQAEARTRDATAAADAAKDGFDRSGDPAEVSRRQIDGLRGAAVTRIDPKGLSKLEDGDPWRARLLVASDRMQASPSDAVAALRSELEEVAGSDEPGALVREAALRANLAFALVRDARARAVQGLDYELELEAALRQVEGWCQIPEALLNAAAIHLELARVRRVDPSSSDPAVDSGRADRHVDAAGAILTQLVLADATSCADTRGAFFGAVGTGKRFAYVLDKSASMNVVGGFDELQRQMERTLGELPDNVSFSVLFFSELPGRGDRTRSRDGYFELPVPPSLDDGSGMFRRGALGDPGQGGGLDDLVAAIRAVQPDGATEPIGALRRALAQEPTSIFLLTDGVIETPLEALRAVRDECVRRGIVFHTVLFFDPSQLGDPFSASLFEAGLDKLRELSEGTGGSVTAATQRLSSGGLASAAPVSVPGRLNETIFERAVRRGYWTPECDRQYSVLAAEWQLLRSDAGAALGLVEAALAPGEQDIVTGRGPVEELIARWPHSGSADSADAHPLPEDPALVYEGSLLAVLAGDLPLARERFDAAARMWARCSEQAAKAGNGADSAGFADLACRAVLFGTLADRLGTDAPLDPGGAAKAADRMDEIGVARSSSWSYMLARAAAGSFWDMKAGVQAWMAGSRSADAELALVRACFGRGAPPDPSSFLRYPSAERIFLEQLVAKASSPEGS